MKHWLSNTKIYRVWRWIQDRVYNKNHKYYHNYWWRWIKCEWNSFEEFYKDMWDSYKEWLTLDRENNHNSYCKENCRWITYKENNRNRRDNIIIKWELLIDICEKKWLDYNKSYWRYKNWWTDDEIIWDTFRKYKKHKNDWT